MVGQTVEVEGIVVGDFQASTQLRGFYLQEPDATWDSDPTTSEGIFIFDNLIGADVSIGDRVRVRGLVTELPGAGRYLGTLNASSLTEIGPVAAKTVCSSGIALPEQRSRFRRRTPAIWSGMKGWRCSLRSNSQ